MLFIGGTTSFLRYFGSFRSFHEVGAGHLLSSKCFRLYMRPVATTPMVTDLPVFMSATGYRSAKLTPFSSLHRPSATAWYIGPSSTIATSTSMLPRCACMRAILSVELPATYSSLAPVFFSNAGMISLRIMSSNEPP